LRGVKQGTQALPYLIHHRVATTDLTAKVNISEVFITAKLVTKEPDFEELQFHPTCHFDVTQHSKSNVN
jgi:hypothetical protein